MLLLTELNFQKIDLAKGVHILYPDSSGHESNAPFVDVEKIQFEVAVAPEIAHSNSKASEVNEIMDKK